MSSRARWTALALAVVAATGGLAGAVASYVSYRHAHRHDNG